MPELSRDATRRLDVFLDQLATLLPRPALRAAFGTYVTGLTSEAERKSLEPPAPRAVEPASASAAHQASHHFAPPSTPDLG